MPLVLSLLLACLAHAPLAAEDSWLASARATKIVTKIYPDAGVTPLAVVRIDKIRGDFQRRGFFRIGVLPLLVLEGLNVELLNTNQLPGALAHFGQHFAQNGRTSSPVEARDFCLSITGQPGGLIYAQIVQLRGDSEWFMRNGVVGQAGSGAVRFSRGTLTIAGSRAGEFAYETTNGARRVHLSGLVPVTNRDQAAGGEPMEIRDVSPAKKDLATGCIPTAIQPKPVAFAPKPN